VRSKTWTKLTGWRETDVFVFNTEQLRGAAEGLRASYYSAAPFPHTVIDNFLPEGVAERLASVFPKPDDAIWLDWTKRDTLHQPRKQGIGHASRLDGAHPFIHNVIYAFNSYPLLAFLGVLTGIEGLLSDPYLTGGGLHQILPGGTLSIHADFNYQEGLKLYRRINLLLYLNKDWKEEYGGDLEMWDARMQGCVKKVLPIFNRCVIFNTHRTSFHGHPEPLRCPSGTTRKSLAFYYYTRDHDGSGPEAHETLWQDNTSVAKSLKDVSNT
jgi:hypothetical protein